MSVGLLALLDDVAGLAKVAAASLDDIAGQAAKAGIKAAGAVVDDAAVTPRYVDGFSSDRELPIVGKIMEDHGGDITLADVENGEGAQVTLTFPFAQKNVKGTEDEQKRIADRV